MSQAHYDIPGRYTIPHNARPHECGQPSPPTDMRHARSLPEDMYRRRQWVAWRYLPPKKAGDKPPKVPYTPGTRQEAKTNNKATWGTYADARADVAAGRADGIGFVLATDDPFFCIDLDDVRDPETNEIDPWAQTILDRFGTYVEPSPSGTGIHIVGYGKKPGTNCKRGTQIECYDHLRFLTITEQGTAPVRDCQDVLNAWYGETWPEKEQPARPQPTWSGVSLTNEQILEKAFRARNGEKIRRLYEGDTSGYPPSQSDPKFSSEADQALVNYLCGYTPDDDQLADLWRSSGLYRKKLDRKDYVERTIQQARKGQSWAYSPTYGTTPKLTVVPQTPPSADAGPDTRTIVDNSERVTQLLAIIAEKDKQIIVLQERIRRQDEREAIQQNKKLGAARATGAVLANLFREEQPKDPDSATGWRVPLKKLAERTGLSEDTCSDHVHKLETYRTEDGTPIVHAKVWEIPRTVNPDTGEIVNQHRELWIGPGVAPELFGPTLATLAPANAPKWGGKPDRNGCPDCPGADVIKRVKTFKRTSWECSCCHRVLEVEVARVPNGPTRQDAGLVADGPAEPDTGPIRHDAALVETGPTRHLASSIDNHTPSLSGNLPGRDERDVSVPGNGQKPASLVARVKQGRPDPEQPEPAWMWEFPPDDPGPPPDWQETNARTYGRLYRGEEAS